MYVMQTQIDLAINIERSDSWAGLGDMYKRRFDAILEAQSNVRAIPAGSWQPMMPMHRVI